MNVIGEEPRAVPLALSNGLTLVRRCRAFAMLLKLLCFGNYLHAVPSSHVLTILEMNELGGVIPSEISRFQELRYLLLEEGTIGGSIPEDIGFNSNLIAIDLNFNALTGTLPANLYRLSNLNQLDLNDNQFTGTISSDISSLVQLVFLQLEQNSFSGTIPETMGNLFLLGMFDQSDVSKNHSHSFQSFVLTRHCPFVTPFLFLHTAEVATLEGNQFQGSMPALVCENRTGLLQVLTADCLGGPSRPSPPYVACDDDCCTQCF